MSIRWLSATIVVAIALLSPVFANAASEPTIKVMAKNWEFAPGTITLKLHQKTKLEFVSTEGVHGITIPDLGVDDVINIQSSPTSVEVTPQKTGTFTAHCAVFCGTGHEKMVLIIKVVS